MKKVKIALATAVASILLFGCVGLGRASGTFSPDQSSVFAARDGGISSALVEACDKDYYDQGELESYARQAVIAYNMAHGGKEAAQNEEGASEKLPVAIDSCTIEDGVGRLIFDYASGSDLVDFAKESGDTTNQIEKFEITTVADGLVQGKITDASFVKKDGSKISHDAITKQSSWHLVTAEGTATVQTEGKIEFMTEGVTLVDDHTATLPGGKAYIVFR